MRTPAPPPRQSPAPRRSSQRKLQFVSCRVEQLNVSNSSKWQSLTRCGCGVDGSWRFFTRPVLVGATKKTIC
jgi:hypothetical protein